MADNYRALTRTYRPTSFDDIVSQEHVSSTLQNAIEQNRLAHAYMFCGPRGVGKTTMARVLARTVNDIDRQVDGESLNQTLNVVEIDAASNNSVDDIRDLRERVRIPPQNGQYKIYIVDEVHMLSKSAFNALLKTLEEPPDHVIFIFATTEPHKVLPTILSRVQRFDFRRISIDQIVDRLKAVARNEDISIDEDSLHVIAKKADGALRDALGLLDQAIAFCGKNIQHEELLRALNVVSTERMFDFMAAVEQQDSSKGLELINELLQEGYDIQEYLVGLTEHLRNLYVANSSEKMHLVEATPDNKKRYKESAESWSEDDLMRMLHIVSEAQYKIKDAQQPKIQFEITLLKLIHMERTQNLDKLLNELDQLKKKLSNQSSVTAAAVEEAGNSSAQTTGAADQNGQQTEDESQNGREPKQDGLGTDGEEAATTSADAEKNMQKTGSSHQNDNEEQSTAENSGPAVEERVAKEADEADALFGKSSLGDKNSSKKKAAKTKDTTAQKNESAPKRAPGDVSLDEVKEQWPRYIEAFREQIPQILYFQMERVEPVELKNGELTLRCNDDFAKQIMDKNSTRLGKLLKREIGTFLKLKNVVQKNESESESKSPYERFKKLQERDPTVRKLVERFGAELDYNLNR